MASNVASTGVATAPQDPTLNYLNNGHSLKSWLLTTDHKRISLLYLISVTVFFFLGGFFAMLIRLELLTPQGDLMQADTYNKVFTMHGMIMVFFFLIPVVPAVLGNFLVPLMIGAKDLAFPRINLLSWYLYIVAGTLFLHCMLTGGVDTGWTFYTPYSTVGSNTNVIEAGLAVFIAGFSSIFTGLNFIVTIHRMRAPGMTWDRLPLFLWSMYATSLIMILGTPVVAITIVLVAVERLFHLGIFDPRLGGDPLLFQHLFWFYSHPAVYIMILPSMGVVSELIACFARKRIFGYKFVALSSVAIAVLGFLVWAHHMFVAGISLYAAMIFSFLTFFIGVPSAVKVFNWTATLYKASISYATPMLYAFGFIGLFTIGGLTGLFLATLGIDVHVTDTYFVVAHFHYVLVGAILFMLFSAFYYWYPKMTGRMLSEKLGKWHFWIFLIGFHLTFDFMHIPGLEGMPRRIYTYEADRGWMLWNMVISSGAVFQTIGTLLFVYNMVWSYFKGPVAGPDPWDAWTLEWSTASPPPAYNFAVTPTVASRRPLWDVKHPDDPDSLYE